MLKCEKQPCDVCGDLICTECDADITYCRGDMGILLHEGDCADTHRADCAPCIAAEQIYLLGEVAQFAEDQLSEYVENFHIRMIGTGKYFVTVDFGFEQYLHTWLRSVNHHVIKGWKTEVKTDDRYVGKCEIEVFGGSFTLLVRFVNMHGSTDSIERIVTGK